MGHLLQRGPEGRLGAHTVEARQLSVPSLTRSEPSWLPPTGTCPVEPDRIGDLEVLTEPADVPFAVRPTACRGASSQPERRPTPRPVRSSGTAGSTCSGPNATALATAGCASSGRQRNVENPTVEICAHRAVDNHPVEVKRDGANGTPLIPRLNRLAGEATPVRGDRRPRGPSTSETAYAHALFALLPAGGKPRRRTHSASPWPSPSGINR